LYNCFHQDAILPSSNRDFFTEKENKDRIALNFAKKTFEIRNCLLSHFPGLHALCG